MKTEIDSSIIEAALAKLGEASARQIADETGLEAKDISRTLNQMHTAAAIEREKRSNEYVYWLTTTAATKPPAKPKASAVAMQTLHTPGSPADITEQLRQARAEHLAMSQTVVEICCAIGHDPKVTTTGQLPQLVRNYIDAQINRETTTLLNVIADIREAIGDSNGRIMLGNLAASVTAKIQALEQQVTELRSRVEAQTLASVENANSAGQLLTEVHTVLSNGWPVGLEAPTGYTTLQLAQAIAKDFDDLHNTYLQTQFPTPDAYLVTRHLRAGRGKTVADTDGPTRHKSIDTATRKARAAIRGGYVRAEIHATNLVAVATLGPEIKPV